MSTADEQGSNDRRPPASWPRALSTALQKLVNRSEPLSAGGGRLSVFHGVRAPAIALENYIERIYKYTSCSPSCFVVGFVYIDRLLHKHPDSVVSPLNVHRLAVTSVMVAAKILDDVHYNNGFYARVGGVSKEEMNRLELELLFLLDFHVYVSSTVFEAYSLYLEKEMLRNQTPPPPPLLPEVEELQ